ncbi:hypothetical protein WJX84_012116 [Apatococcus fuscideae]|uniref:Protein kinase domain-containing protein n=1 Tax=Apatococcus fuscideae TaxID=2026836 RepID=A0AAW1T0U5_9CHLO
MESGGLPTPPGSPHRVPQAHIGNGGIKHVGFAGEKRPQPSSSGAEGRSSLTASQLQSQDLVKDVKQSVAELRLLVKDAVSHREKCCTVLSSALAVSLALEQVIYSGPMTATRVKKLQRLSADTISNVTLAGHCVKAYGLQGRLEKYLKKAMLERPEEKFEQISQRLERLAEDAWDLTEDGGTAVRLSVHRGRAPAAMQPGGNASSSGEFEPRLRQQPAQVQPPQQQEQQPPRIPSHDTILTRARLRRGSHLLRVRALLYITPDMCSSSNSLLGQVWWYITGQLYGGKLMVHDLATGRTEEIGDARRGPVMHVMHQDANGIIWSGHKYGSVRIWDEGSKNLICAPLRVFHADVMCITSDEREGFAWAGSSGGGVSLLEAQSKKKSDGKVQTSLEVILELRHPLKEPPADRPLGRASTASPGWQSSSQAGSPLSVRKQESKSFTTSVSSQDMGRLALASDPRLEGKRAHGGSVMCMAAHSNRVWTSGGSSSSYNLREWSSQGLPLATFDLQLLGPAQAMMMMRSVVHVTFPEDINARGSLEEPRRSTGQGDKAPLATVDSSSSVWQLVTAHSNGQIQVWDPSLGSIKPVLRIGDPGSSCRDLILCESMGLLCSAHVDGSLIMRILPAMDQRDFTVPIESSNITTLTSKVATIKAHRSALACAVGGSIGVISAGVFGSIMLWPEAEIRSLAEAQGFMLPEKLTSPKSSSQSMHEQRLSTSRMLQRYYTPKLEVPSLSEHPSQDIGPHDGAHPSGGSHIFGSDPGIRAQLGSFMSTSSQQGSSAKTKDTAAEVSSLEKEQAAGQNGLSRLQTIHSDAPATLEGSSPWASGNFAETASNWLIDFKDLTFKKMIGEGSIGRVHLGKWQETDVAIKVLGSLNAVGLAMPGQPVQPALRASVVTAEQKDSNDSDASGANSYAAEQSMSLKTLEREVGVMIAIRHPNVVLFMGLCMDPPCMVTEFCARGSLYDVLTKARAVPQLGAQLDWTRRLNIALDAAKGMLQLHSHRPPILHRDLKSPNLLVDKHWRCKIADFNLSRVMETTAIMSSITANNPRWLAPEVITRQEYSKAADVFSFGIILWELLVWRLPWEELGPFQIMVSISERKQRPDIPPMDELPGDAFQELPQYVTLLEACWQEEPEQRPSFESVITSLRAMLELAATSQKQQRIAKGPDARLQPPVGTAGPASAAGPDTAAGTEPSGPASAEASGAERRVADHNEMLARPSSGPLDGFAIAISNPSDTRAIDGREGLQMALGQIPHNLADSSLTQPAVAIGRQSHPSLEQAEAQRLQAMRARQGPFAASAQQQPFAQSSSFSQPNPGVFQPQGPFAVSSQQQQPQPQFPAPSFTQPVAATQQFQGPLDQQQQQGWPRSARASVGSPPHSGYRSVGGLSSVSSGIGPWQDPRYSLDTRGKSLSSCPASLDIVTQMGARQDAANAAYADSAARSSAYMGDVHLPVARVPVESGPSSEYVSPFAAMDPLAPFPSTVLSGELPEHIMPEGQMGSQGSLGDRKWSPRRPHVSPFLAARRVPSPGSSADHLHMSPSMTAEDAMLDGSRTRIGQVALPESSSDVNSSGSQDIQPEVLLRGGSYTRPDRVFSNVSAVPMQSVPEGCSLSKGANRDDLPHLRPPPRVPSHLSPLRHTRLSQGADDPHAPLFVTSRSGSGSGSGFPIGQLQPNHHQGPGFLSGRLPSYTSDTGMQPSYAPRLGITSSGSFPSGSGSPPSLSGGRGISLPASLHNMKFGHEGLPDSPAAELFSPEQLQTPQGSMNSAVHASVQQNTPSVAAAPAFDGQFLGAVPRSDSLAHS